METPIGKLPAEGSIDTTGLDISEDTMNELFSLNKEEGLAESEALAEYFKMFGDRLPKEMQEEADAYRDRFVNS